MGAWRFFIRKGSCPCRCCCFTLRSLHMGYTDNSVPTSAQVPVTSRWCICATVIPSTQTCWLILLATLSHLSAATRPEETWSGRTRDLCSHHHQTKPGCLGSRKASYTSPWTLDTVQTLTPPPVGAKGNKNPLLSKVFLTLPHAEVCFQDSWEEHVARQHTAARVSPYKREGRKPHNSLELSAAEALLLPPFGLFLQLN